MKVLVTFAVEAEFAAWRKLHAFNLIDYQGLKLRRTKIGAAEVTVLITGVGSQAAALAMDLMMRMADKDMYFDVCISSGLAGALCETLSVGDIIAPKELIAELKHADLSEERLQVDAELRHREGGVGMGSPQRGDSGHQRRSDGRPADQFQFDSFHAEPSEHSEGLG